MTGTSLSMKSLPHHPTKITPFPRFLSLKKKHSHTTGYYTNKYTLSLSLQLQLQISLPIKSHRYLSLSLSLSNFLGFLKRAFLIEEEVSKNTQCRSSCRLQIFFFFFWASKPLFLQCAFLSLRSTPKRCVFFTIFPSIFF